MFTSIQTVLRIVKFSVSITKRGVASSVCIRRRWSRFSLSVVTPLRWNVSAHHVSCQVTHNNYSTTSLVLHTHHEFVKHKHAVSTWRNRKRSWRGALLFPTSVACNYQDPRLWHEQEEVAIHFLLENVFRKTSIRESDFPGSDCKPSVCLFVCSHISLRSSAIAQKPRDALHQLNSCQLLHSCRKNHIWKTHSWLMTLKVIQGDRNGW